MYACLCLLCWAFFIPHIPLTRCIHVAVNICLCCVEAPGFFFFFFTHHLYQSVHLKSLPRDKSWQMQIIQTFMCCNTFVVELNGKYKLNGVFKKNITCFYSFNLMLVCCILVFASTLCVCKRYIHSSRGQYDRWLWSSV